MIDGRATSGRRTYIGTDLRDGAPCPETCLSALPSVPALRLTGVMALAPIRKGDLRFVQHELDTLAEARAVSGLSPVDARRYQQLCHYELNLLHAALGRG
jgi:hypothetical protein